MQLNTDIKTQRKFKHVLRVKLAKKPYVITVTVLQKKSHETYFLSDLVRAIEYEDLKRMVCFTFVIYL